MKRAHSSFVTVSLVLLSFGSMGSQCLPTEPNPDYMLPGARDGSVDAADLTTLDLSVVACTASVDCKDAAAPLCVAGKCVKCGGPADDAACAMRKAATPRCDAPSGACVACRATPDCSADPKTPICDRTACRGCKRNDECASGVCNPDGACAADAEIVFVDNKGGACVGLGHAGSAADPHCQIAAALSSLGMKRIVKVAGSKALTGYEPFSVKTSIDVRIVGPGVAAIPAAEIKPIGIFAVEVNIGAGMTAKLQLEGLVVFGSGGGSPPQDAVNCFNGGGTALALTLRDCSVQSAGKIGVSAKDADVTITSSTITGNQGGGVSSSGGTLTVTSSTIAKNAGFGINVLSGKYNLVNNFIVENPGTGITFTKDANGVFAFNTVAGNVALNQIGIDCGGLGITKVLEHSIVVRNSTVPAGMATSQFAGNCTLANVVTGPDAFAGARMIMPRFKSEVAGMLDFHLLKGDPANVGMSGCCVDKVSTPDAGAMSLPATDIDGDKRPLGLGWDVGADEVE